MLRHGRAREGRRGAGRGSVTSPAAIFRGKTREQERAERRAERREALARLRLAVFDRANGRCEKCGLHTPSDLHHMRGGSGRRREAQTMGNCVALCRACHAEAERHKRTFRCNVTCLCGERFCTYHEQHFLDCPCSQRGPER